MLAVFWQTLDMQMPKYQLDSSLIGSNPGLGFRPTPPEYQNVESSLIWYRASDNGNVEIWTKLIDEFLTPYTKEEDNQVDCSFDNPPPEGKVCKVPMTNWSPCVKDNRYNFKKKSPCIFLKLNKIYNWVPDMYNTSINLPEKMPDDLKEHIRGEEARGNKNTNVVWVSCAGENPADNEHIGAIQYIPRRGFPGYFFPYKNVDGYLPPVVAVYFEKPKTGVLINIECKAWARNIMYDRAERRGSVHFELMID
uniref:Sodium/potassium-transporting ATPase subunit beta n=2 Tax=Anopheles funestus TaxID=62324 RepID=A0A182RRH8_ANOFN